MPYPDSVMPGVPGEIEVSTSSGELLQLMRGFVVAKSLYVAARLGLADLLTEGPRAVDEIATRTSTHPRALYRLMRALSSIEIFDEVTPGRFALGRLGAGLTTGVPNSFKNWVLVNGGPIFRSFDGMMSSIKTGRPAFEEVLGLSFFDYFEAYPDEGAEFHSAMADVTRGTADSVLHAYDFTHVREVVDVGGGNGALIAPLLQANPWLRGVLFDRPQVIEAVRKENTMAHLQNRCQLVSGDFFESVPAGADVYLLAWILHDWDDDRAVALLRSCREAIAENGRILLIEAILPSGGERHFSQFGDIVMLVSLGGQERTESEYRDLLGAAGFRLSRVIPTGSPRSIIEAIPA